ncbi:MAG: CRTAC1 family protein [Hyphomonadaceae bacterium]
MPSRSADAAHQCGAIQLIPEELVLGDGVLDRGFIGGVSLVDADGDGDLDIYATRGYNTGLSTLQIDRSMLYLNDGAGAFARDEGSAISRADEPASGSTWGDIDHDGDLDVFVSTQLGRPDAFYRNLGGGRFAREQLGDATATAGSNFTSAWADIDGDGDLDLISGGPTLELPGPVQVYRNDGGRAVLVPDTLLSDGQSNAGAILWIDVDNDGDQDMFVANSDIIRQNDLAPATFETSRILRNDGGWSFTALTGQGFDDPAYPMMNAAFGDIDNDGDFDLFAQMQPGGDLPEGRHRSMSDRIFRNDGAGHFSLDANFEGPEHTDVAGGAAFADFDLDGDLDLIIANYSRGIRLYRNDGTGRFAEEPDPSLNNFVTGHAAVVTGDFDGDGAPDVAVGAWSDDGPHPITMLRNRTAVCSEAIRIRLYDQYGAPDPIGARVTLVTAGRNGERRQLREAMGQTTIRGQSGDAFYFGVPPGEHVRYAEIRWPGGRVQRISRLRADQLNTIRPE